MVIVPVRSPEKAKETLVDITGDITTLSMALADVASIRRFAKDVIDATPRPDLLINNAGIKVCPETRVGSG